MAEQQDFDTTLSTGAIRAMYDGGDDDPIAVEPTLQVLSVKKVNPTGNSTVDRYRLIVSDGEHFAQAMLATQLNGLLATDPPSIEKNTVIKLNTYACNVVQNRRIIICLSLEPIAHVAEKIGSPQTIDPGPNAGGAAAGGGGGGGDVAMKDVKPDVKPAPAPAAPAPAAGRGGSNASSTSAAKKQQPGRGGAKGGAPIYPIEGLSPYQNKWTIKARVTVKSDIRHWSNAKGDGKLFSVNLLDDTGEIKATGFNDACENLYPLFEEGKVYYISKARVNIAKKQFSNLSSEYEIMFEKDTDVQLCEDQESAPQIKFNFVELGNLGSQEKDATVDVLGIIQDNGDLSEITAKATQKQIKKRELTIVDRSGYSVRVTLWGRSAETWQESDNGVFAFKGAKVGDFGGRTLSMGGQSTMMADPDIAEAHDLRGWYDTEGNKQSFQSYSNTMTAGAGGATFKKDEFRTFEDVTADDTLGMNDKPDFFSSRATITFIKSDNLSYPACPTEKCNKKMSQEGNDEWRCEKCSQTYPAPEYRYILSLAVNDFTSQIWISGFNEMGLQIIGKTADEMQQIKDEDEGQFNAILGKAMGQMYNFSIRAKADTYQDQTKVRFHIQKAAKVNYVEAARQMLETLEQWGV